MVAPPALPRSVRPTSIGSQLLLRRRRRGAVPSAGRLIPVNVLPSAGKGIAAGAARGAPEMGTAIGAMAPGRAATGIAIGAGLIGVATGGGADFARGAG